MKTLTTGVLLLASASAAHAIGLDRSNQDITAIFEDGNYVELSFGSITPSLSGTDLPNPYNPGGFTYGNVGEEFTLASGSIKYDINERFSIALIADQPFGADIAYPGAPNTWLGGTGATAESFALTALGRYRINDMFSVHAGLRSQTLSANITLSGAAYSNPDPATGGDPANPLDGLNGYNVDLAESRGMGYVFGVAYERPDIALRVALTYNSSITHEFDTVETLRGAVVNPGSVTEVDTPEAWNLDFQTGVAENTLVFGQIRYADYEQVIVSPTVFAASTGGQSLTDIETNTSYSIGVARRFSEAFSASVSVGFEPETGELVSPLDPTDGRQWVALGGQYTAGNIVLSGGVRYTMLGDSLPETGTPDVARATFEDNDVVSVGLSVGYRF